MPVSEQVCFHEAGHAFMSWYLGVRVRKVRVLSHREIRYSRPLVFHGGKTVAAAPGVSELYEDPLSRKRMYSRRSGFDLKRDCRTRIFIALAGPLNTEIIIGWPLQSVLAGPGAGDKALIDACRAAGGVSEKEYAGIITRAREVLYSPPAIAAMRAITRLLMVSGKVSGGRVASLCRARVGDHRRGDIIRR